MRLGASVGKASRDKTLENHVYKLTMTADTEGECKWLAGLFAAVREVDPYCMRLGARIPVVKIQTER